MARTHKLEGAGRGGLDTPNEGALAAPIIRLGAMMRVVLSKIRLALGTGCAFWAQRPRRTGRSGGRFRVRARVRDRSPAPRPPSPFNAAPTIEPQPPSETERSLLDTLPEGVVQVDSRGRLQYINRAVEAFGGVSRADMLGQRAWSFVDPADRARIARVLHAARDGGSGAPFRCRLRPRAAEASHGVCDLTGRLIETPDGAGFGVVVSLQPVEAAGPAGRDTSGLERPTVQCSTRPSAMARPESEAGGAEILAVLPSIAVQFLRCPPDAEPLQGALDGLRETAVADGVYVFRAETGADPHAEMRLVEASESAAFQGAGAGAILQSEVVRWQSRRGLDGAVSADPPPCPPEERERLEAAGIRAVLVLPLQASESGDGALALVRGDRASPWSSTEIRALAQAAALLEAGLDHARPPRDSALYREIIANANDAVAILDADGVYLEQNRAHQQLFGHSDPELMGQPSPIHGDDAQFEEVNDFLDALGAYRGEVLLSDRLGNPLTADLSSFILRNADGAVQHYVDILRDVTERRRIDDQLRQAAIVFDNTSEGVLVLDRHGQIVAANPAFSEITGLPEGGIRGRSPDQLHLSDALWRAGSRLWRTLASQGRWQGEVTGQRRDGERIQLWLTVSAVHHAAGEVSHYVAVFADISPLKAAQEELDYLARYDSLTGLPNRIHLEGYLPEALERAADGGWQLGVVFLDFDRFKDINDSLGHPVGDGVLQRASARLKDMLRPQDRLARLGGDEFMILLEEIADAGEVVKIAERILAAFQTPFRVQEYELQVSASLGISLYPSDGDDPTVLTRNADAAMFHAKEQGGQRYHFYTRELTETANQRVQLEMALRRSLERDDFYLLYQPQVDLTTGRVLGVEALLRWNHPDGERVSPGQFIPLAEETGLILPIGEWVIQQAFRQMAAWQAAGLHLQRIAINVSPVQLQRGELVSVVRRSLEATGVDPARIELEVTEAVFLRDTRRSIEVLNDLERIGVRLAIDDFGTGYSSLSYLKRFPLHRLKIDQSFVAEMLTNPNDAAIARAIIALGESLGLAVIAEGIETRQHVDRLRRDGCWEGQGFLFSRPIRGDAIAALAGESLLLADPVPGESRA